MNGWVGQRVYAIENPSSFSNCNAGQYKRNGDTVDGNAVVFIFKFGPLRRLRKWQRFVAAILKMLNSTATKGKHIDSAVKKEINRIFFARNIFFYFYDTLLFWTEITVEFLCLYQKAAIIQTFFFIYSTNETYFNLNAIKRKMTYLALKISFHAIEILIIHKGVS